MTVGFASAGAGAGAGAPRSFGSASDLSPSSAYGYGDAVYGGDVSSPESGAGGGTVLRRSSVRGGGGGAGVGAGGEDPLSSGVRRSSRAGQAGGFDPEGYSPSTAALRELAESTARLQATAARRAALASGIPRTALRRRSSGSNRGSCANDKKNGGAQFVQLWHVVSPLMLLVGCHLGCSLFLLTSTWHYLFPCVPCVWWPSPVVSVGLSSGMPTSCLPVHGMIVSLCPCVWCPYITCR